MVPVFDQRQMLLDFELNDPQGGLKLFLVVELEAHFVVLGVTVLWSN
jgi:hypothetical protein